MGVPAASQGRGAERTQAFMLPAQHCQLRAGFPFFFILYFLIPLFAYSPRSQTSLVALDTWIGPFASHLPPRPPLPCPPTNSNGVSEASNVQTPPGFSTPRNHSSVAAVQRRAWHRAPAASGMFHPLQLRLLTCSPPLAAAGIAAAVPKYKRSECLNRHESVAHLSEGKTEETDYWGGKKREKKSIEVEGDPWESPLLTRKPQNFCAIKGS